MPVPPPLLNKSLWIMNQFAQWNVRIIINSELTMLHLPNGETEQTTFRVYWDKWLPSPDIQTIHINNDPMILYTVKFLG